MALYCSNCGAELQDGVMFCDNCGTKVEGAPAAPAQPASSAEAWNTPAEAAPAFAAAPAPAPKKPMSKKTKIILCAVAAVVVVVVAFSMIMKSVFAPEKTVDKFLTALEEADYAAFSKVATVDGAELSETAAVPMFELYDANKGFRDSLSEELDAQLDLIDRDKKIDAEDAVVKITEKDFFLFSTYKIAVSTVSVDVGTDFKESKVTINGISAVAGESDDGEDDPSEDSGSSDGGSDGSYTSSESEDADNYVYSEATIEGLLPGKYDVTVEYTTSYGEVFTETGKVEAGSLEYNSVYVPISYETIDIYNFTDFDATVTVGSGDPITIAPYEEIYIMPLKPGAEIVVSCVTDSGSSVENTLVAGDDYYYTIEFMSVYVNNPNSIGSTLTINGNEVGVIEDDDWYITLDSVVLGDVITATPNDSEIAAMVDPVELVVEENYGDLYTRYQLNDATKTVISDLTLETLYTELEAALAAELPEIPMTVNIENFVLGEEFDMYKNYYDELEVDFVLSCKITVSMEVEGQVLEEVQEFTDAEATATYYEGAWSITVY